MSERNVDALAALFHEKAVFDRTAEDDRVFEHNVDADRSSTNQSAASFTALRSRVHMGGTMPRDRELEVIRSGGIHYKHAEILEASVRFVGTTAIVLNRIRLDAVVGGNEVTNPFMVTEVYVQEGGTRKLAVLAFTRLLTP